MRKLLGRFRTWRERQRTRLRAVARLVGPDDVLVGGGLLLVAAGAGWVYPPAGLIVLGAGSMYFGGWYSVRR